MHIFYRNFVVFFLPILWFGNMQMGDFERVRCFGCKILGFWMGIQWIYLIWMEFKIWKFENLWYLLIFTEVVIELIWEFLCFLLKWRVDRTHTRHHINYVWSWNVNHPPLLICYIKTIWYFCNWKKACNCWLILIYPKNQNDYQVHNTNKIQHCTICDIGRANIMTNKPNLQTVKNDHNLMMIKSNDFGVIELGIELI